MRRTVVPIALLIALAVTASATAGLVPLKRRIGDVTVPRVVHVDLAKLEHQSHGTTRVIVTLGLAPLAQAYGNGLGYRVGERQLNVATQTSQVYLAKLDAAQKVAIAELKQAIPQAKVSWRYRIVLDGFTVSLPATKLQKLLGLGFVRHVYPSARFTLDDNESPAVIGATALEASSGASGAGIKIGVVDDGIDQTNQFFNPSGYSYPPGFPKGNTSFTSPKVIVARAFPGPGSGAGGQLPLDRQASFHGTHVAGIAAGDANTTAPPGPDHPQVAGLSGVAPRAWLGNYRVFNVPAPFVGGDFAETPEIVAAFESAVADGMNVINFSGGGPESDPANDAMIPTVKNVAAAGVVPVIAAGNDRDDFGLGTVGSPGSAPDAITVAAVTNSHFFGRALTVLSPTLQGSSSFPAVPAQDGLPASWSSTPQPLQDVGKLTGKNGKPVDRHLCGTGTDPNAFVSTLPDNSLKGKIALVERGSCTFVSKAYRVVTAGAIGMILIDNRSGDPDGIPLALGFPMAMISDLDGARLLAATASTGGLARIEIGSQALEIQTGRSGVITSFSSAGPTDFGHLLKPDISAPGAQVLSSTLPEFAGSPFAVFDGTSMATPHIAGSAALLLQLHPGWTPKQIKSALMSTAVPAYSDTTRSSEAPVLEEGAGLAWLPTATNPLVFTDPQSLSFPELNVSGGAKSEQLPLSLTDAGGGDGTWTIEVHAQSATNGAAVNVQPMVTLAPGAGASLTVTASASADAAAGDDYGFLLLHHGSDTRRVPYYFTVGRSGLAAETAIPLKALQTGDTSKGENRASVYRWPSEPFGPPASYTGPAMNESGNEHLYVETLTQKTTNFGVSIQSESPGSVADPWLLSAPDENDVLGYAATPVNVNGIMFDYQFDIGSAGAVLQSPGTFYFSVDAPRDPLSGKPLAGPYVLRSWVNDVTPPRASLLTTKVAAGRPTIALHVTDSQSGVDPFSVAFGYGNQLVGAAAYDPKSGTVVIPLPASASLLHAGHPKVVLVASDYQESKNVNTIGANALPNTVIKTVPLTVVNGPAITWVEPQANACAAKSERLVVLASDTSRIAGVTFFDGARKVATASSGSLDIYGATWKTAKLAKGRHVLKAVVSDRAKHTATATRVLRVC
ncbi:MAG TPA: S8 family serine peptidase [Gaiellaceae bacterium]|nr:S8 family serine peptidase [Gaiellaceae bacterium]